MMQYSISDIEDNIFSDESIIHQEFILALLEKMTQHSKN